jgi:fumarylacetoacetate (FAA) hydrolase
MRFVTFLKSGIHEKLGLLHKESVIDVEIAANELKIDVGIPDILHVIRNHSTVLPKLQKVLEAVQNGKAEGSLSPMDQLHLISPVPHPISMRDGYAFRQHVEAARRNRGLPMIEEFDNFPIYYYTNHLAVTGPGEITFGQRTLASVAQTPDSAPRRP